MKHKRVFLISFLALLLSSCSKMPLFHPSGQVALEQRNLIIIAVCLMLIVVVPVIFLTLAFAFKYRASNTSATYSPNWSHSYILEFIWWGIPCVICLCLGILAWKTSHSLDPYKTLESKAYPTEIEVSAVALDWKWLFIYPNDHIATVNSLVIPENIPIHFRLTGVSAMNSFWIPALGGQIYVMAGMESQLNLIANSTGNFYGTSANFSGPGFSDMHFNVKALSSEQYAAWLKNTQSLPSNLTIDEYKQLRIPSRKNPIKYYGNVTSHLFEKIIEGFKVPNAELSTH